MNPSVDAALLQMVQQHVHKLIADVDNMAFEVECDREAVENALQDVAGDMKELEKRISDVEEENKGLKRSMESFQDEQRAMGEKFKSLKSDHDFVQQRVTQVEEQLKSSLPQVSFGKYNYFYYLSNFYFCLFLFNPVMFDWMILENVSKLQKVINATLHLKLKNSL